MQVDPTTQKVHMPQEAPSFKFTGLSLDETATFMCCPLLRGWLTAQTEIHLEQAKAEKDPAKCYFVAYANAADFLFPLTLDSLDFPPPETKPLKTNGSHPLSSGLKHA